MKEYIIVTDSTTDLPASYADLNGVTVVPLSFMINGKNYSNHLDNRELSSADFYSMIRAGAVAKTSQVNAEQFYRVFKEIIDKGYGVLGIFFSSGLSGTYNSARLAYLQILEEYENAPIYIIDSLCASLGEGLLVHYAVNAKKKGLSLEENCRYIEGLKLRISHWFTVMDMDTLKRGGRISAASAFFAKTLNINPVLHVSNEGKLVARTKKIGRRGALRALLDKFLQTYIKEENDTVFISHSSCLEEAQSLAKSIKENTDIKEILINDVGPVIGGHCGVGTIALFFVAAER